MQWFRHVAKPHTQADMEEWNRRMLSPWTHHAGETGFLQQTPGHRRSVSNRPHQLVPTFKTSKKDGRCHEEPSS